jgi:triacylglycerol lipase
MYRTFKTAQIDHDSFLRINARKSKRYQNFNQEIKNNFYPLMLFLFAGISTMFSKKTTVAEASAPDFSSQFSHSFWKLSLPGEYAEYDNQDNQNLRVSNLSFKSKAIRVFQIDNAYACCLLSRLVYSNKNEIEKSLSALEFSYKRVIYDAEMDTQVLIAADDKKIIVAYRGTQSARNWQTNFNLIRFNSPSPIGGNVHLGFHNAAQKLWPEVSKTICEFQQNKQPIWFTGHSLGGAISTISAAYYYAENKDQIKPCIGHYSFGEPRCGDAAFSQAFEQINIPSFYVINCNDPVPVILPRTLGFNHVGKLFFLDENGRLSGDSIDLLKKLSAEAIGTYNVITTFTNLTEETAIAQAKKAIGSMADITKTLLKTVVDPLLEHIQTYSVPFSLLFEVSDHGIGIYESKLQGLVCRKNQGLHLCPDEALAGAMRHSVIRDRK